jgi:hypothetical protein
MREDSADGSNNNNQMPENVFRFNVQPWNSDPKDGETPELQM